MGLQSNDQVYLSLQPSEKAVYDNACRLLAACIGAGEVTPANQEAVADRCITLALGMAKKVDDRIDSDDESKRTLRDAR